MLGFLIALPQIAYVSLVHCCHDTGRILDAMALAHWTVAFVNIQWNFSANSPVVCVLNHVTSPFKFTTAKEDHIPIFGVGRF
jgi:hypothetical protein